MPKPSFHGLKTPMNTVRSCSEFSHITRSQGLHFNGWRSWWPFRCIMCFLYPLKFLKRLETSPLREWCSLIAFPPKYSKTFNKNIIMKQWWNWTLAEGNMKQFCQNYMVSKQQQFNLTKWKLLSLSYSLYMFIMVNREKETFPISSQVNFILDV